MHGRWKTYLRPALIGLGLGASMLALAQDVPQAGAGLMRAPSPEVLPALEVDWDAVLTQMQRTQTPVVPYAENPGVAKRAPLPDSAGLNELTLPVLLPAGLDPALTRFVGNGATYDAVYSLPAPETVTVIFSATRVILAAPPGLMKATRPETLSLPGGSSKISYTLEEAGASASFTRFGVLYSIQIHCGGDDTHPWCSDTTKVAELASQMTSISLGDKAYGMMVEKTGFKPGEGPSVRRMSNPFNRAVLPVDQAGPQNPVKP